MKEIQSQYPGSVVPLAMFYMNFLLYDGHENIDISWKFSWLSGKLSMKFSRIFWTFPGYLKNFQAVSGVFGQLPIFESNFKAVSYMNIFQSLQKLSSQLVFWVSGQCLQFLSPGKLCLVLHISDKICRVHIKGGSPFERSLWESSKQPEWSQASFLPFWWSLLFFFQPSPPAVVVAIPAASEILHMLTWWVHFQPWHLFQVSKWKLCHFHDFSGHKPDCSKNQLRWYALKPRLLQ